MQMFQRIDRNRLPNWIDDGGRDSFNIMGGDSSQPQLPPKSPQSNPNLCLEPQPQTTSTTIIKKSRYVKLKMLGYGTSGKVYECLEVDSGKKFAMKTIEMTSKSKEEAIREIGNLKRQIGLLKQLSHPNIVGYFHFDVDDMNQVVEIILEKVTPGNLRDLVKKKPYKEAEASNMTKQILEGLKYLHDEGIVHRDLKGANILVNESNVAKIADFGTAKLISSKDKNCRENIVVTSNSLKGTPYWMAPEVLKRTGHRFAADIWSLGCTVIEMLTGTPPWSQVSQNFEEIIKFIISGMQPPFPHTVSRECQHFLNCCLDTNPNNRLTAKELLNHKWIKRFGEGQRTSSDLIVEELEVTSTPTLQFLKQHPLKKEPRKVQMALTPKSKLNLMNSSSNASIRPFTSNDPAIQSMVSMKQKQDQEKAKREKQRAKDESRKQWEEELKAALQTSN